MFTLRRSLFVLSLILSCSASALAQKKLTAVEAKEHYGEAATVCGEVVSASYAGTSNGQPTFLNLDRPFPNQVFTVVIWGEDRSKFGNPEDAYKGKRICATGKITAYGGLPEIVATEPKQIAVETKK